VASLHNLDAVETPYADRSAAFRERYCSLEDGNAAARVIDRVMGRG
jgi:CDP-glycerol glycerophosphotransferase